MHLSALIEGDNVAWLISYLQYITAHNISYLCYCMELQVTLHKAQLRTNTSTVRELVNIGHRRFSFRIRVFRWAQRPCPALCWIWEVYPWLLCHIPQFVLVHIFQCTLNKQTKHKSNLVLFVKLTFLYSQASVFSIVLYHSIASVKNKLHHITLLTLLFSSCFTIAPEQISCTL